MQQAWRKRLNNISWVVLGAVTLVLLVSAVNKKNSKRCNGIDVSFNEDGNNFFVDEKGVISLLEKYGSIKGEEIKNINLSVLENQLKNDKWIENAELFFDNKQVLRIIIEEKQPVARIFTISGSSFYIDSLCKRLPLSEKLSARIPMFTGFPSERINLSRPDSQVLASVKDLALFIQSDEFWKAQVSQVDITPDGFEMIPTVGSHVVKLGREGDWQQKFDRLFSFYKQVWTRVGFERYEKIDVQFNGQVVATIKGAKSSEIDSAEARKAYESLVAEVEKNEDVTLQEHEDKQKEIKSGPVKTEDKTDKNITVVNVRDRNKASQIETANSVAARQSSVKKNTVTIVKKTVTPVVTASKEREEKRVPKAIMRKSVTVEKGDKRSK